MKLKYRYAIGTHVMFYEIEVVKEFVESILQAVKDIENPQNIIVDITFNMLEHFEKIDYDKMPKVSYLNDTFGKLTSELNLAGVDLRVSILTANDVTNPYTMAHYRRDFNYNYCEKADYLIWGESDCLIPKETFEALEQIKDYAVKNNIHRYITTFAVRKMWDASWAPLEHPEFEGKQYLETKDPKAFTELHSIRYTANIDEMNEVNSKTEQFDIRVLRQPKFDGSMLVISSDLIKAGVNIPHAVMFVAEDSAFMNNCLRIMGQNYIQFVVKNIWKVHNRSHPDKRKYIKDEDIKVRTLQNAGKWYNELCQLSKENLAMLDHPQAKFHTFDDYDKIMEE